MSYNVLSACRSQQDCVCLVAPQPYNQSPVEGFDLNSDMELTGGGLLWYARPQLFFNLLFAPLALWFAKATGTVWQHKELALVIVSSFEPSTVTPNAVMQRNGVPMFYNTASSSKLPALYICWAKNVLGRVLEPLIPCFVDRNRTPTLPQHFGGCQGVATDSSKGAGNGRGFMSSTPGYGVMAGGSHAGLLLQRKESVANAHKWAAKAMKLCREERGKDYYSSRSQEATAKPVRDLSQSQIKVVLYVI